MSLTGGVAVDYHFYGKDVGREDVLNKHSYGNFDYVTLKNLKDALSGNGDTHFYRLSASQIELRSQQISDNGKIR